MRTVVIVSPHFPPSSLAGVHRARHLAGHLPAHGWRPIIVRVAPDLYMEPNDFDLARMLPPDLIEMNASAVPVEKTRRFGLTDLGLRGYFGLRRTAEAAATKYRASAIMLTGSPFYPLLNTAYLKRNTGLPVLVDFQDPWVNDVGGTRPFFSKGRMAHRLASWLEPQVMAHADFVTSVSERQNANLRDRYPHFDAEHMAAIPIGGDPADFDKLRENSPSVVMHRLSADVFNFSYVGTIMPRTGPVLDTLLRSLAMLKREQPALASRIRFNFVGTSNQVNDTAAALVLPIAEHHGIAELVRETPSRVPYLQALHLLANSDGLLMLGSDEPHYTASKIYPNLMAKRPYLSIFHKDSSAHQLLQRGGGGRIFGFADVSQLEAQIPDIASALAQIAVHPRDFRSVDEAIYSDFTASGVAASFASIFDRLAVEGSVSQ